MATIKVKRNSNSRGKCKLAFNKAYTATEYNTERAGDVYAIGEQFYPKSWFTPVPEQQPKHKPVVKPDPKTGKFVVEKPERDWSKPQAFPEGYKIKSECRAIKVGETLGWIKKGAIGTIVPDGSDTPKFVCDDINMNPDAWKESDNGVFEYIHELAPLNPTDHPEHPDFGKAKPAANWQKDIPFEFEFIEKKPQPQPFDIREVIAGYIRQHGTQLTAIELIGHLTIDAKWQSTEK